MSERKTSLEIKGLEFYTVQNIFKWVRVARINGKACELYCTFIQDRLNVDLEGPEEVAKDIAHNEVGIDTKKLSFFKVTGFYFG